MKISSTKKAAILATVLGGFVLGQSAEAAKLGIVTASDYVTSHMGAIEGSFINSSDITAIKSVISGLNGDPAVYNTVDPVTGKSTLYIRQYTYSNVNLQNSYAFDAQGDWNNRVAGTVSKATNAHDVARYKDFVYVASYDEGTVGVAQVTDSVISDKTIFYRDLKNDLETYGGVTFGNKAQLHGEGVVIIDGNLYVIANCNPQGGYTPYNPSYLIKYAIMPDGRLSYDGYTTMGKNTDSVALNVYNNYMLATAIGGYQYYGAENSNAETSIDVVTLNPENKRFMDTRQITLPENLLQVRDSKTIPKSEFRSLKVLPNGTAYVMTYNIGRAGKNVDVTVYQTTVSNLLSANPQNWKEVYHEAAAPGWFGRLDAEYNTKRLWVQVGNKLHIYTDGATDPKVFGTDSFATNAMYEELYTWDIIRTDVIPEGKLVKVQLATGEWADTPNENVVVKKENGTNITAINNQIVANVNGTDAVINLTKDDEGNLGNNVLAGIYAEGISSTVNANNGLQIQVENNVASPVGVYATDAGLKINAKNGKLEILTKTMDGGNSLTNAIWLDPTIVGGESITIDAKATNITMEGGYGGNGVAIQKTDRWGENSKTSALGGDIVIKGDLNIKGATKEDWGIGANPENVISRFNNAGIFVDVNNSKVEVKGNVDMDVYGNGVTVNGKNSTVTIVKGGSITVPTGTDYGYYTLAAYEGTINMNMGTNGKTVGENDVKLNGDIFALSGATINLGLATADSHIKGIIDNGGTVNLTLQNGATWTNEANNSRYCQDNEDIGNGETSRVTKLKGGSNLNSAGIIVQTANSDNLLIDNLEGAIKVNYTAHGENSYADILGGTVTIDKAATGSQIAMITSNNKGIATRDIATVDEILGALASKLYYNDYATNGSNLTAVALGLSEGLTSSSVTKQVNIDFSKNSGSGNITGNITDENLNIGGDVGGDDNDNEQVTTGPAYPNVKNHEAPLYDNDVFVDATPNGVIDTSEAIKLEDKKIVTGLYLENGYQDWLGTDNPDLVRIQINGDYDYKPVAIYNDAIDNWAVLGTAGSDKTIDIVTVLPEDSYLRTNAIWIEPGLGNTTDWLSAAIQSSHGINITMVGGHGGNGIAITRSDGNKESDLGGYLTINGDVKIKGTAPNQWGICDNPDNTDARYNNSGILLDVNGSSIEINGSVYMDVCGNGITVDASGSDLMGSFAAVKVGYNVGNNNINYNPYKGSQILVPTGNAEHKYYSLAAYNGNIQFDGNGYPSYGDDPTYTHNTVPVGGKIDGDWYVGGENAAIDARMKGSYAYFNGAVINEGGTANLYMVDGATWTNVSTNGEPGVTSHLTNFRGTDLSVGKGTTANYADAKIIQTADSGDILIDKFHNNATVIYGYEEGEPTNFQGGDITIISATAGSNLTLQTNYSSAITFDNVEEVLNSLAGKLYYTGYTIGENNLKGYLKIGEGLTASSITAELLNGGFIDNKGSVNSELEKVAFDKESGTLNGNIKFDASSGKGSLGDLVVDGGSTPDDDEDDVVTEPVVYEQVITYTENTTRNDTTRINGGPWHKDIGAIIYASGDLDNPDKSYKTIVNLNGKDLVLNNNSTSIGSGAAISAIDGGIVEINNPGNITITENCIGPSAGIFANGGGVVHIKNGEGGVVRIDTQAGVDPDTYGQEGAGIKTMNGLDGVRSKVIIDGMVHIVADLDKCNNEALSAVASDIEIGGGHLEAKNGAWCAIRAYGEFVSDNAATVNVNVVKDEDGNITGAGERKTNIIGDFVTNGGMGTLGYITVGLNGDESYWTGNYGDNRGYGVTKGQEGNVTLYMKNGADWTGFSDGEMNVTMEGEGTTWYGFNIAEREPDDVGEINGGLTLTLTDKALWQNAITKDQGTDSKVYTFIGDNGFIDMTGNKTFIGHNDASHAENSNGVSFKNTSIEDKGKQETGNLKITNYSGNTTIIYRRDDNNVTKVLGGTTTIEHAEKGSKITLSTDGYNILNKVQVAETLDNLAEKLYYTNYVDGERNLKGYVQIAEGLTTSSVGKHTGNIDFSSSTGQGSLNKDSLQMDVAPDVPGSGNEDDNQGNEPTTPDTPVEPEKPVVPEEKPVEKEFGGIGGDLTNDDSLKNDKGESIVSKDESGNNVVDFGKLDIDQQGNAKPEHEEVDKVIIAPQESTENTSLIGGPASGNLVLEMKGKDLDVTGKTTGEAKEAKGIEAVDGSVTIKDAGNIVITTEAVGNNGKASAIYASGEGKDVTIHTDKDDNIVKLSAKDNDKTHGVLHAEDKANVTINGLVDITETNGKVAVNVGEGSTVTLAGGEIGAKGDEAAIKVTDGGKIKINEEAKDHDVVINGKIVLGVAKPVEEEQAVPLVLKLSRRMVVPTDASSVSLTTADSALNDNVEYAGNGDNKFGATIANGAKWTGNSVGGVDLTVLLDDGGVWTGYHNDSASSSALNLQISNGAIWENTAEDATTIDKLAGAASGEKEGFIRMSEDSNAGLTVEDYSGETTFIYRHNADNDILGGNVNIKKAADGSVVNVRTNSIGTSDKEEVAKVLKALAAKMIAKDENGNALSNAKNILGEAQIAEGIVTSASALKVGNIDFTNGTGVLDEKSITAKYDDSDYIYGDSETAMMKGAKSAMASTVMMWRSESNDLLQRMGDVRLATEESGVWAKYYGGKYEMDAQNTNFSTSYKAYQVGYDKAVGNGWNVGVAVSHNEGDSRYDRGGEGEMTVTSLSVYGNKDYGDGRYLGLILKGSQLKNEYEVFNNDGYKLEGDFKTWGTSISAEYGKRIEKGNGFYFDPSVELTVGHVQGKDYTATSDMLAAYGKTATMQVEQDDFNSIIGRVGFGIGQRTDKASYYAKLALAHEFGGDFDTHYTAEETKGTNIDFGDTWYEMQLGGTAKLSDNSLLYATYERSFGGDVTEKWRVDAGLRVTF